MSFFYGVNSSTPTNASSSDPFDKTTLPGHNFKDPFMTGVIVVVVLTMISLCTISILLGRIPAIGEPLEPWEKFMHKKHPAEGMGGLSFWYILYLTFELIIRICVELRLTVPYAFIAIEIPSRFFLMVADLVLLWCLMMNSEIIHKRLSIKKDSLHYASKPLLLVGVVAIILVFFGERIAYIVMMVGYGFRWNKPDTMYYAVTRTAYAGGYLLCSLLLWIRYIRMWLIYRRRVSGGFYHDRCGKIPFLLSSIIGPCIAIRGTSAFCFTLFFRLMKKQQNPDLELLRMGALCLPLIVIWLCHIPIRKQDLIVKVREAEQQHEYASDINLLAR